MKQKFVSYEGAMEIVEQHKQALKYHQLRDIKITKLQPSSKNNKKITRKTFTRLPLSSS